MSSVSLPPSFVSDFLCVGPPTSKCPSSAGKVPVSSSQRPQARELPFPWFPQKSRNEAQQLWLVHLSTNHLGQTDVIFWLAKLGHMLHLWLWGGGQLYFYHLDRGKNGWFLQNVSAIRRRVCRTENKSRSVHRGNKIDWRGGGRFYGWQGTAIYNTKRCLLLPSSQMNPHILGILYPVSVLLLPAIILTIAIVQVL